MERQGSSEADNSEQRHQNKVAGFLQFTWYTEIRLWVSGEVKRGREGEGGEELAPVIRETA